MEAQHITADQMQRLLNGDSLTDDLLVATEHVAGCEQCRSLMESTAADADLWRKTPHLIAEPMVDGLRLHATDDALAPSFLPEQQLRDGEKRSNPERDGDIPADSLQDPSVSAQLDPPNAQGMIGSLGGYDIECEVGRGGMGIVYKAHDTELHRILAIKVLAPWLAQNGTARQRFAREARAAAAVIHPNVVAIYGVDVTGRTPYLVMPFVAGPSLQQLIQNNGPLDEKDAVRVALQITSALTAAHAQGLVHRDIKPGNILVEADVSRVLVTDFGLARAVDDASATQSGYFAGTPNYMSPEQSRGLRVDARSDLFSLGSVIYFAATGRMPFRADSPLCVLNRINSDEPTAIQQLNPEISPTLSAIVAETASQDAGSTLSDGGCIAQGFRATPDASPSARCRAAAQSRCPTQSFELDVRPLLGRAGFAGVNGMVDGDDDAGVVL